MSNEVFSRNARNEGMQPLRRQIGSFEHFVLVSVRPPFSFNVLLRSVVFPITIEMPLYTGNGQDSKKSGILEGHYLKKFCHNV